MASLPGTVRSSHQLPIIVKQSAPVLIPGVLILGITREPLYVTPLAHNLLVELAGLTDIPSGNTALPLPIQQVCSELQHDARRDPAGTDWDKMQASHLIPTAHGAILVRGYGIMDRHSAQTGRFLILLESVHTESSPSDSNDTTDCHFTKRQRAILDELVLGHTNKEIAKNMLISVHTVKEYVRQLMTILHTRSRTGIAAQAARLTLTSPKPASRRSAQASQTTVQQA
jgi:DNA-binding CsgD family transcriptional regulator